MELFALKLFIVVGLLYLFRLFLEQFPPKEPARKILFMIALLAGVIWLLLPAVSFLK